MKTNNWQSETIENNWGSNWGAKDTVMAKFKPEKIDMSEVDKIEDYETAIKLETQKMLHNKQIKQMHDMRDHKYYACVVFANENDKNRFFELLNKNIEIIGETFIDGYDLAEKHFEKIAMTAKLQTPKIYK
jgi:hypothetical protein